MITKEEFLNNTNEEELFSILHEFKEWLKEEFDEMNITDKAIYLISKQMIRLNKISVYL